MGKAARLIFVPAPGAGHLRPFIQMAKSLTPHFSITFLIIRVPNSPEWETLISSIIDAAADSSIQFIKLPQALKHIPEHASKKNDTFPFLSLIVEVHKPVVKETITAIMQDSIPVAGMFIDAFLTNIVDVAKDLKIPPYFFFTSSAAYLGTMLYLPTIDSMYESEMAELAANGVKLDIPSLSNPLPPLKASAPTQNRKTEGYKYYLHCAFNLRAARGIAINSSADLESFAVQAIRDGKCIPDHATPKLYPIGPIVSHQNRGRDHECLRWLDLQPQGSVVFLCFGSFGSFSRELSHGIAVGLERSGHRFLWCLRSPGKENHSMPVDAAVAELLPEGFLERTREKGLVWNTWAPQMEILGHEAVGGFVSHCGWNSCLETMWNGMPVLAWPWGAEQKFNAFEMAWELGGVAMELEMDVAEKNGNVAEVLERGVRCLLGDGEEGKKLRERAKEVKMLCRRSVEESGSSAVALKELVNDLMNGVSGDQHV